MDLAAFNQSKNLKPQQSPNLGVRILKWFKRVKLQRLILTIVGVLFLGSLMIYLLIILEPQSKVENLFITNISDRQATVSWTTPTTTRTGIIISENGQFPLLPILGTKIYKNDNEKNSKTFGLFLTHHVTITGLKPNTKYSFIIYQGYKKTYQGQFKTGPTLDSLNIPRPIYGTVLSDRKEKKGVAGALVYLMVKDASSSSALLSTLTNSKGNWSIDLANLRTSSLASTQLVASSSAESLVVDFGRGLKVKAQTTPEKDQPWPIVYLTQ